MNYKSARALLAFWMPVALFLTGCDGVEDRSQKSFILTTASTGGTYYPVGVAISTLVKLNLQESEGISLSAINSAGSGENIKLMRSGEADFALIQGLFGFWAKTGEGVWGQAGPQLGLRSITMLWPNVEHFAIRSDAVETGTLADLRGLDDGLFGVGNRNSGAMESTKRILQSLGIEQDRDLRFAYLSYNASADALQNGTIDGFSAPAGAPVSAVSRAMAAIGEDMAILTITPEELAELNEGIGLWTAFEVPAGTYPGQDEALLTAAQPNFLAVNADVDDEVVYQITKVIFENLPFLYSVHRATRSITLDTAMIGLPVPLHPGSVRYFAEQGLQIPQALVPLEMIGATDAP
ncbi:MAG: TAXI family TRAP transporter solute-binding subunit [Alphaproteobacteria bacterium]